MNSYLAIIISLCCLLSCKLVKGPIERRDRVELPLQNKEGKLFILNSLSQDMSFLDLRSSSLEKHISLNDSPDLPCLSPNIIKEQEGAIFIVCSLSQQVLLWDRESLQLMASITLPDNSNPWDVVQVKDRVFISSFIKNAVFVYRQKSKSRFVLEKKIDLNHYVSEGTYARPQSLLYFQGKVWVAMAKLNEQYVAKGSGAVAIIDEQSLMIEDVFESSFGNTAGLAISPDQYIYAVSGGSYQVGTGYTGDGGVDIIDPYSLLTIQSIATPGAPFDIVFHQNERAYLSNGKEGDLLILNWKKLEFVKKKSIKDLGCSKISDNQLSYISSLAVFKNKLYLTEFNTSCLLQFDLDSEKLIKFWKTGAGPADMELF